MPMPTSDPSRTESSLAVLELATGDPLAALRHVAACLARRSYPLLGLTCSPGAPGQGRLVVAVADDGRLERLVAELCALPEVFAAHLSRACQSGLAGGLTAAA